MAIAPSLRGVFENIIGFGASCVHKLGSASLEIYA